MRRHRSNGSTINGWVSVTAAEEVGIDTTKPLVVPTGRDDMASKLRFDEDATLAGRWFNCPGKPVANNWYFGLDLVALPSCLV